MKARQRLLTLHFAERTRDSINRAGGYRDNRCRSASSAGRAAGFWNQARLTNKACRSRRRGNPPQESPIAGDLVIDAVSLRQEHIPILAPFGKDFA